jgi:DNA-binding response OmpR family regulator
MHGRILIVEDEEPTAAFVQTVLEQDGFTVEWAGDGATALAALDSFPPNDTPGIDFTSSPVAE